MTPKHGFRSLVLSAAFILGFTHAIDTALANGGIRRESIYDPVLKMNAFTVSIPANWKFEGAYVAGSSFAQIAFAVCRAYASDGFTELRRYPRLDWTWSDSSFKGRRIPAV